MINKIRAYQSELDNIVKELSEIVEQPALDALIRSTIQYAYALGKSDGYVAGVRSVAGETK